MATIMNPTPSLSPGAQAVLDYIRTNEVMRTLQVVRQPVPAMDYIIQGSHIALPLAESLRAYATPHWLPICFRPIENCAAEQLRAQKARERWEGQAGIAPRTRANA
jgi:hypothetical protein